MDNINALICFCILMEGGDGIRSKSPDYIQEKYRRCMSHDEPEAMLDINNLIKFTEYKNTWLEGK